MEELKMFTREGNQYVLKRQYGFTIIVITGLAAFGIGCFWISLPVGGWIFMSLTVLSFIAFLLQHVIIDMDDKEIISKVGLLRKPVHVPIADFINFEVVRISYNFIPTNVNLNIYYRKDGKEKVVGIAQAFTTRHLQNMMNEIDEIIRADEHSGKI